MTPSVARRFLTLLGGRLSRDTSIYVVGMLAVGPFSLISVVVLTRLLDPTQYGELALLFFFSAYLTMLYNTGSLHGTFMLVYGAAEGEGDDVASRGALSADPKRALGTGVALTLTIVMLGTVVCILLAPTLAELLLQRRSGASLICWAAASAAAGSLWRLTVNVFRMERQPLRFASFNALRPLFVVGGSVPLVACGFGVEGALAGTTLGTLAATAVCVAMTRSSYAPAFSFADAREILRRGSMVVVPVVALFVVHNIDVLLLSRFAPAHEVGLYRVAARFAAVPSYFASAFLMAWAPLERGVLFQATYRHVGEDRVRGALLTYYLLAGMTIVVLLDVAAGGLILLAGPGYRSAAPLIPLIGIGFVCYGLYVVLVRAVKVERRMLLYAAGAVIAGALDIGLSTLTIPWLGAYGVPLAMISGVLLACALWIAAVRVLMRAQISFQARPLIGLAGAVAIAAAIQTVGLHAWPAGRPAVLALVLVGYLGALLVLGVVPVRHLGLLARLAGAAVRRGTGTADPARGLEHLTSARRKVLAALERDRVPLPALAARLGWPLPKLRGEYVMALRESLGTPEPSAGALDGAIADYLLSGEPLAIRDNVGCDLVEAGADALELMELDEAAKRLRALEDEQWPESANEVWRQAPPIALGSPVPPAFAGIARELRDGIIAHHERRGERLDTPAGRLTLDTNSMLAAQRGRLLLRLLAEHGMGSVEGLRVLDLGAGFGALALYFAHLGAEVVAVDPNESRLRVAHEIAQGHDIQLSVIIAHAQSLPCSDADFDLVVANNSLCYVVDRAEHRAALTEVRRVLRAGGWVAMRNPNRLHPRDQFTGLPLLPLLSPRVARGVTRALRRHRSEVRLHSPGATVRELRRVGFTHARWRSPPGARRYGRFAGYHHVLARRGDPAESFP